MFAVTVFVTVTTDLLIGIGVGVALKLVLSLWYMGLWHALKEDWPESGKPGFSARLMSLIRNPVARREFSDGTYHIYIDKPLVCFNLFHLIRELERRSGRRQDGEASSHPAGAPRRPHDLRVTPSFPGRVQRPGPDAEAGDRGVGPDAVALRA